MINDLFRMGYRPLTDQERDTIHSIKLAAAVLHEQLTNELPNTADPRCVAVAKTKLEECVMWATKAITI